jgi:hypothetical protein
MRDRNGAVTQKQAKRIKRRMRSEAKRKKYRVEMRRGREDSCDSVGWRSTVDS